MIARLPVPRVVAVDGEALERRARALASGADDGRGTQDGLARVVAFRLRGTPCAVELAAVERAVVLTAPVDVPLGDGTRRAVAFVDERPLPVADLAGTAAGRPRAPAELAGSPALVVATPSGPVAVAVEGPLDLAEDRLLRTVEGDGAEPIRLAGRLGGGAALLDARWLPAWAAGVVGA